MAVIVLNALNSNSGGGRSIRDGYLNVLKKKNLTDRYIVIVRNKADLPQIENKNIEIRYMNNILSNSFMAPFVYEFVIGKWLKNWGATVVINWGDLIINAPVKQFYIFDWPYALEVHPKIWSTMTLREWITRRVKLWLLSKRIRRADVVGVQTEIAKSIIEKKYSHNNVRVIDQATVYSDLSPDTGIDFGLPNGIKLLSPSLYYTHKNLESLIDVAVAIRTKNLNYKIILTISATNASSRRFLRKIKQLDLGGIIFNVGTLPGDKMPSLYKKCDAVVIPTLLETFGLTYIEAMAHGLPVLTSDMWFAHAVCKNAARYFNPFDPMDILASVEEVFSDENERARLVEAGFQRVRELPDWDTHFEVYQSILDDLAVSQ